MFRKDYWYSAGPLHGRTPSEPILKAANTPNHRDYRRKPGRMRYGPDFTWERPHDRGSPPDQFRGRLAIQHSEESLRVLAKRHGINQKTVAKWKKRTAVKDLPTGPRDAHSTVLSIEEEAIIVAFRKHTRLPQ